MPSKRKRKREEEGEALAAHDADAEPLESLCAKPLEFADGPAERQQRRIDALKAASPRLLVSAVIGCVKRVSYRSVHDSQHLPWYRVIQLVSIVRDVLQLMANDGRDPRCARLALDTFGHNSPDVWDLADWGRAFDCLAKAEKLGIGLPLPKTDTRAAKAPRTPAVTHPAQERTPATSGEPNALVSTQNEPPSSEPNASTAPQKEPLVGDALFHDLARVPFLVPPVFRHFGGRPTRDVVFDRLRDKDCGRYSCAVLKLWDDNEGEFPITDPRYTFTVCGEDWTCLWRRAIKTTRECPDATRKEMLVRLLRRYSTDDPCTPARLLKLAVRKRWWDEAWSWPSPVRLCEHCKTQDLWLTWDSVMLQFHTVRLCAVANIKAALRERLLTELVGVVLSFLTLDKAPQLRLPPGPEEDLVPEQVNCRALTRFLSAIKFEPVADTPGIDALNLFA